MIPAVVSTAGEKYRDKHLPFCTLQVLPSLLVTDIEQLMRDDFHRILSAFHALDPEGNGYIPADTMKRLMSENGEPMSEEEINIMMAACCDDDGKICYENYAYLLAGDGRNI